MLRKVRNMQDLCYTRFCDNLHALLRFYTESKHQIMCQTQEISNAYPCKACKMYKM